ncbi:MAG: hypothetical protein LKE51_07550 [Selenomonas sp.]|jgi:hypothetical protein|nr:hypothetical protein [Selenomonas sp.]
MDSILVIILFAILAILSDKLGGKKKVPPRPRRRDIDIQLPPPVPQPWPGQHRDAPAPGPRLQLLPKQRLYQWCPSPGQWLHTQVVSPAPAVPLAQPAPQPRPILPPLTLGAAQQAVVMAEILGRPRAYRNFQRR